MAPQFDGYRLKVMRLRRGLSIEKAGVLSGFTGATWSSWERKQVTPRAEHLSAIAELLRCEIMDLFREANDGQKSAAVTSSDD